MVKEITSQGGKAVAVQANVTKQADVVRLFDETAKAFDRLDILVNNAGVGVLQRGDLLDAQFGIDQIIAGLRFAHAVENFLITAAALLQTPAQGARGQPQLLGDRVQ